MSKPIKCPNCGKRMITLERGDRPAIAWMACALDGGCGVRGPLAERATGAAAVRLAVRLTREWIARMEVAEADAFLRGVEFAKKWKPEDLDEARKSHIAGNNRINEAVDKFESPVVTP